MMFTIPCELQIIPGGPGRQNKLRLSVNGETVFDCFQGDLAPPQLEVAKQIAAAHARLLAKWAGDSR